MQDYTANRWIKIGLVLVVLGWGPLLAIVALAAVHLWPDPNPNPIGAGLLFFVTFWPAVICLGIGATQVARRRKETSLDPSARVEMPSAQEIDWISNPVVRAAVGIVGIILIVEGGASLAHGGGRGAAAALVLGAAAIYWALVGRFPAWLRR
jgi:hypothetical protein